MTAASGSFPPSVCDMNRQAEHRPTHRALIESCEPRQGEFSDSPHLGARARRQKTSVSAAAEPRLTSRRCQITQNRKETTSWFWDLSGFLLFRFKMKNPLSSPGNLFSSSWRPPVEQVKLGEGFLLFLFIVCRFLCVRHCFFVVFFGWRWAGRRLPGGLESSADKRCDCFN